MQKNIGAKDKNYRLGAGAVLLILSLLLKSGLLALIGVVLLVTAVIGFCPAYTLLKMDTLNDKINKQ